MEVQGAGGSGNNEAGITLGTTGAAGGYAKKLLDVSSISTSTITVGSGGASVSATTGNAGGLSSWADGTNTITGSGGSGANSTAYTPCAGGAASGGDINITGSWSSWYTASGPQGNSMLGMSGGIGDSNAAAPRADATGYGSGGRGMVYTTSVASGAGGGGIVIVWEYK
jgi:hypothetical protein